MSKNIQFFKEGPMIKQKPLTFQSEWIDNQTNNTILAEFKNCYFKGNFRQKERQTRILNNKR